MAIRKTDDEFSFSSDDDSFDFTGEDAAFGTKNTKKKGKPEPIDTEKECEKELNELLDGFKARATRENNRMLEAVDSEFWVAICFQTRAQKEEFLKKAKLLDLGDKYLDGMLVAEELGIELTSPVPGMPKHRAFDREFVRMTNTDD